MLLVIFFLVYLQKLSVIIEVVLILPRLFYLISKAAFSNLVPSWLCWTTTPITSSLPVQNIWRIPGWRWLTTVDHCSSLLWTHILWPRSSYPSIPDIWPDSRRPGYSHALLRAMNSAYVQGHLFYIYCYILLFRTNCLHSVPLWGLNFGEFFFLFRFLF